MEKSSSPFMKTKTLHYKRGGGGLYYNIKTTEKACTKRSCLRRVSGFSVLGRRFKHSLGKRWITINTTIMHSWGNQQGSTLRFCVKSVYLWSLGWYQSKVPNITQGFWKINIFFEILWLKRELKWPWNWHQTHHPSMVVFTLINLAQIHPEFSCAKRKSAKTSVTFKLGLSGLLSFKCFKRYREEGLVHFRVGESFKNYKIHFSHKPK